MKVYGTDKRVEGAFRQRGGDEPRVVAEVLAAVVDPHVHAQQGDLPLFLELPVIRLVFVQRLTEPLEIAFVLNLLEE